MESPINPTKLIFTKSYQRQHHTTVKDKLRELHWFADDTLRVNEEMDKLNIVDPAKIAGYVKNASAFLKERYPKLGNYFSLADKPPKVYFIGKGDKQKVKKILNYKYDIPSDNFYYLKSNIIVVTSTGDDRYDESIVCHELDHAINSTFVKNTRGDAWKVGYATEVEDVISRGTALEEGLVYMDQKEFFCRDVSGLDKFVQEAKFDVMGGAIYSKYENLVKALAKGVSVFMGRSESNKFMDNLRAGRFDGKSRFRAEQTIDRVFGSGTSKNLMSLGYNEEEVLEFTRYLVRITEKRNQ